MNINDSYLVRTSNDKPPNVRDNNLGEIKFIIN